MIKSLKLKLWLVLFITLVLSLSSLLAFTHFSVKQRFLDYATNQILERLEPLEQAVIEVYGQSDSLTPFTENTARWNELRNATYRQYLKAQKKRVTPPNWTARQSIEKKLQTSQRAFFQQLILLDHRKKAVAGNIKDDEKYVMREIRQKNAIIAYIGYVKPKAFLRPVDKLFVDQQLKAFVILSVLMIFAALFVTLFVSRWLVTPLSLLAKSAKRVAAGDFSVRVGFKADDELGKLCQDFDEMTHTLEKNEVNRKQWVADISHEMRTPLSVLKAQIEAFEDGIRKPTTENLGLLMKNVDSLSSTVDDLYELSLADTGALNLDKQWCTINDVVSEVALAFREKAQQQHLDLHTDIPKQAISTFIDKKRVKQVLVNVIENSIRYTDTPGKIIVSLQNQHNQITIQIDDSAPSVAPEALESIFDRLYRVESSRNRNTGGAGLGLSICQSILKEHGGSIVATPSDLGGIKQTITLPGPNTQ